MLSLRVALRYLFSKKSHNAVNILSMVSVVGVAIATMAMVIILSVFNGFSDMAAGKLSLMDPDLLVIPAKGKVLLNADAIARRDDVAVAAPLIREQALAVTPDGQMPVTLQGMTVEAVGATGMQGIMLDGEALVGFVDDEDSALDNSAVCVLSVGVAVETGLRGGLESVVQVYVPRRRGRINQANPMTAFRGDTLLVAGVYRVEQAEYDNDMIVVPIEVTRSLLEYDNGEASAVQLFLVAGKDINSVARDLEKELGENYRVLDRIAQQQQAFNMIAVEKWVTLLMLAFILVITSFNIISSMYILRVEKQGNVAVLRAMGATPAFIRSIFGWQARLITIAGGAIGLLLGTVVTLIQQWGKVIKLQAGDMSSLVVEAYPVRLEPVDLVLVAVIVIVVAFLSSLSTYWSKS